MSDINGDGFYFFGRSGTMRFGPLEATDVEMHLTDDPSWYSALNAKEYESIMPLAFTPGESEWSVSGTFKTLFIDQETLEVILGYKPSLGTRLGRWLRRLIARLNDLYGRC